MDTKINTRSKAFCSRAIGIRFQKWTKNEVWFAFWSPVYIYMHMSLFHVFLFVHSRLFDVMSWGKMPCHGVFTQHFSRKGLKAIFKHHRGINMYSYMSFSVHFCAVCTTRLMKLLQLDNSSTFDRVLASYWPIYLILLRENQFRSFHYLSLHILLLKFEYM